MKRPCFALSVLMASLAGALIVVGSARCETGHAAARVAIKPPITACLLPENQCSDYLTGYTLPLEHNAALNENQATAKDAKATSEAATNNKVEPRNTWTTESFYSNYDYEYVCPACPDAAYGATTGVPTEADQSEASQRIVGVETCVTGYDAAYDAVIYGVPAADIEAVADATARPSIEIDNYWETGTVERQDNYWDVDTAEPADNYWVIDSGQQRDNYWDIENYWTIGGSVDDDVSSDGTQADIASAEIDSAYDACWDEWYIDDYEYDYQEYIYAYETIDAPAIEELAEVDPYWTVEPKQASDDTEQAEADSYWTIDAIQPAIDIDETDVVVDDYSDPIYGWDCGGYGYGLYNDYEYEGEPINTAADDEPIDNEQENDVSQAAGPAQYDAQPQDDAAAWEYDECQYDEFWLDEFIGDEDTVTSDGQRIVDDADVIDAEHVDIGALFPLTSAVLNYMSETDLMAVPGQCASQLKVSVSSALANSRLVDLVRAAAEGVGNEAADAEVVAVETAVDATVSDDFGAWNEWDCWCEYPDGYGATVADVQRAELQKDKQPVSQISSAITSAYRRHAVLMMARALGELGESLQSASQNLTQMVEENVADVSQKETRTSTQR